MLMETYKKIGIIGAMDAELERLLAETKDVRRRNIGGSEFVSGKISGVNVVCVQSGIGKVNAAFAASVLICRFHVDAVFMTGIAGAISGKLKHLDLIVPDGFIQHDVAILGESDGFIDIVGKTVLMPDKRLSEALAEAGNAYRGIIATGEQFIGNEEQKRAILSRFPDVIAVDMECSAVVQVCVRSGIPVACVKVVSDGGDGMEYYVFKTKAAEKAVSAVLGALNFLSAK